MNRQSFTRIVIVFLCATIGITVNAQDNDAAKQVASKQYVFKATSAACQSAAMRQLIPGEFDVRVTGDSVIASLPYYGTYYAGSQTASGIQFKSSKFEYDVQEKKKGKVYITIRPKDVREVQQLFLTIFADGTAIMQVNSSNREPMSFNGYLAMR